MLFFRRNEFGNGCGRISHNVARRATHHARLAALITHHVAKQLITETFIVLTRARERGRAYFIFNNYHTPSSLPLRIKKILKKFVVILDITTKCCYTTIVIKKITTKKQRHYGGKNYGKDSSCMRSRQRGQAFG